MIYLAEVQTIIKVRNLKYGMISRDNPIRCLKHNSLKMAYSFAFLIGVPSPMNESSVHILICHKLHLNVIRFFFLQTSFHLILLWSYLLKKIIMHN